MKPIKVEAYEIPASGSLDAIHVFWYNIAPGIGHATITCWGLAWTCYFGAMGTDTIQGFFVEAGTDYLINKLGPARQPKKDSAYLGRIIDAVKTALARGVVNA